jgi:hypothetical protein
VHVGPAYDVVTSTMRVPARGAKGTTAIIVAEVSGIPPHEELFDGRGGRAVHVADSDGHDVELWTWGVAGNLAR